MGDLARRCPAQNADALRRLEIDGHRRFCVPARTAPQEPKRARARLKIRMDLLPERPVFRLCEEISILFRKNTWQMLHKYDIITTNSVGEAMRIIAGEARGRRLYAPGGEDTRPTADRIRESVFGILGLRVREARVLDLFAGTGALALEALSRGAACATLVEKDFKAVSCIRRNAEAVLGKEGLARAEILRADYRAAIERMRAPFDLVFLDPPYRMEAAYGDALARLRARGLLASGATVVLERAEARTAALPEGFFVRDGRLYGETRVEFVECDDEGERA